VRTTIDQIVNLQMTLRYLSVPIWEKSYVFGDWPHMPSYTRDTTLYHSIVYERQLLPNMLWSSICWANTTLPTFSASTGLMLWYGEPWMPFYLLEEIHGIF
jgi:hypothetical protein